MELINELDKKIATPLDEDLSSIVKAIGDADIVMLGEASHGTYEFYQTRINISKALIEQKKFNAIAIEGDWPATLRVHQFILNQIQSYSKDALSEFNRFPKWMWRNETMPAFLDWLKAYNQKLSENKCGFYGLDLYSLHESMQSVIRFLLSVDKEAAAIAKKRYSCFDHVSLNPQEYGFLVNNQEKESCIKEVTAQFLEMQNQLNNMMQGKQAEDYFFATQNARVVKDAENYYRAMFRGSVESWNVRDTHMLETVKVIREHIQKLNQKPKIIIWAHNSHLGDARATEMCVRGEINLGQLIRENYSNTYSLGFSTYEGTVTAASDWGGSHETKTMNRGVPGSYEKLFHDTGIKKFFLNLKDNHSLQTYFKIAHLQRAIGVIYRPDTEMQSHYFLSKLPQQFDGIVHIDKTRAIKALDDN